MHVQGPLKEFEKTKPAYDKIFQKCKKTLATEYSLSKSMRYAMSEILLFVIAMPITLQIDNRNKLNDSSDY